MCLFPNYIHAAKKRYFKVQGLGVFSVFFSKISDFLLFRNSFLQRIKSCIQCHCSFIPKYYSFLLFRVKSQLSKTLDSNNSFSVDLWKQFPLPIDSARRDLQNDMPKHTFFKNFFFRLFSDFCRFLADWGIQGK